MAGTRAPVERLPRSSRVCVKLNRYALKQFIQNTPLLERTWALTLTLRARVHRSRGRRFEAARLLLRLEKHLGARMGGPTRARSVARIVERACRRNGTWCTLRENALLAEFARSAEAIDIRQRFAAFGRDHQVRLRLPRQNDDPERQGDLIILKVPDSRSRERGVLLIKYNTAIVSAAAVFDLPVLASEYTFVLEPSNWGYQDAQFLLYLGRDVPVVVECARAEDFNYISSLDSNMVAARIGDGEWVDPALFLPRKTGPPRFDVVMVAAWDPLKRHDVLFRAIAALNRNGQHLKVALIGYPLAWTRDKIQVLIERYGVGANVTIFERIPHADVATIVADAGVAVLLSREEGSNRSVYECLFADTPVIVYREHRGINLEDIGPEVGRLSDDDELADTIVEVLQNRATLHPRQWATRHSGFENATRRLNAVLQATEVAAGRPWTRDIVAKKSAPNVRYAEAGRYREFERDYERLEQFLRPVESTPVPGAR